MFKTIIVGVDGSDHAKHALGIACDLASKYDSALHLVNAPELGTVELAMGAGAYSIPPSDEQVQAAGKQIMDEAVGAAKKAGITPASAVIGRGTPWQEVVDLAEKKGADLIVTGRRGLGGVGSIFLGSTTQKIAHEANCACLSTK